MRKLCLIPVLLCCLLHSATVCSQLPKIYINPKSLAREKQSKFIDSIRFIPLHLDASFSLGSYTSLQVSDRYFLVTDFADKNIFLFTRDGAFAGKVSFKKLGNDFAPEYQSNTNEIVFFGNNKNYTLTPKDKIKIALDWNNPRNKKYFKKYRVSIDDSSFALVKDSPDENDILEATPFYDDYFYRGAIATSPLYKDSLDYEFRIYRNRQLVKGFFPYNRINEPRFLYSENEATAVMDTDTPYIHLLARPFCDTVYRVVRDSVYPAWQLVLPSENILPATAFAKPFRNKSERENYFGNQGNAIHQVTDFYETPDFILCSIMFFNRYESFLYRKSDRQTFKADHIKADSSQYNLQLLGNYENLRHNGRVYSLIKAADLLPYLKENPAAPVPAGLEAFIKSNPPDEAPLIVEFQLRKR